MMLYVTVVPSGISDFHSSTIRTAPAGCLDIYAPRKLIKKGGEIGVSRLPSFPAQVIADWQDWCGGMPVSTFVQLGNDESSWTLYPTPPSLNCCSAKTRPVQRLSKYVPSNFSDGTRNLSDKTLPLLNLLGLVMTKPSLKTPTTFVEYSNESEVKSRQQKLTGTANWEQRVELSVMDE
jgi:hypothetical protein